MIQRTLAQARPALTQVAGQTGMSITDPRFIERLNLVQEELMNEGDFPGVVDRWHILFDEITGELVLPYYLDRLLQVTVDRCPTSIVSPWAEFINYGTGPQDDAMFANSGNQFIPRNWIGDCLDRGEVVSRFPIPPLDGPWKIRVYATVSEEVDGVNPFINFQGYGEDDLLIRSLSDGTSGTWYNGENVEIDVSVPFTVTTHDFKNLKAVVKPQTNGYVRITAWNGTTEVTLSDYAPVETDCSYRNYFIQQLWRPQQGIRSRVVLARARRRFVPVAEDNDELIISNINALKCGMVALWKRDSGDYDAYSFQKSQAVDLLRKEATGYLGKSRTPAISFTRGFPLGAYPYVH